MLGFLPGFLPENPFSCEVVNLLFHNFPDQKIVLVAHSNQALNDLFEKIVALDIPERYLLRLGRGIEDGISYGFQLLAIGLMPRVFVRIESP